MEYKGLNLQEAVDYVIKNRLDEGKAGLIAVSKNGEVACGLTPWGCLGAAPLRMGLWKSPSGEFFQIKICACLGHPRSFCFWWFTRLSFIQCRSI
ncbi:hypothetical protein F3Y22_tig00111719pilonHSYRG00013 [Hibiscus syriacus]|uniref:Uncharacterized protein n=1 Tax=Hibiscus syriacus TaxID=106335 RepID=A0A6A2Y2L4_HIBSY|nr:hypothetical protein F3Y22_tig00111719pilonHSYRG00013 [Hibiscus syriacus]